MDYIWQVKYEIEPSLQNSEEIDGINFEVRNGKTFVTHEHITNNYSDISSTVCKEFMSRIRGYMLRRMLYQKTYQPLSVKIANSPFLLNREELKEKGAKLTRRVIACCEMIYSLLEVDDSICESENFWKEGFSGKSEGFDSELLRIASWIEKSETEQDQIQKFILTWVSFNSLYGLYSRELSNQNFYNEIPQFTETVQTILSIAEAREIFQRYKTDIDSLSKLNLSLRNGTNCSDDLSLELQNINNTSYISIIIRTIECVYCIRNHCFHNGPQITNLPNYITHARDVLLAVVAGCSKNFVTLR